MPEPSKSQLEPLQDRIQQWISAFILAVCVLGAIVSIDSSAAFVWLGIGVVSIIGATLRSWMIPLAVIGVLTSPLFGAVDGNVERDTWNAVIGALLGAGIGLVIDLLCRHPKLDREIKQTK